MYYALLIIAAGSFSTQYVFSKFNQKTRGTSLFSSLTFGCASSLISIPLLFIIGGFKIEFSSYSAIIALIYGGVYIVCLIFGVKALAHANLVLYSLFLMLGGMLLPIFYGLIIGESMSIFMITGVIALILSMLVSLKKTDDDKRITWFAILCFAVIFTANGLSYILTSFHQSNKDLAVSPASFVLLCSLGKFIVGITILSVMGIYKKCCKRKVSNEKLDATIEKINAKKALLNLLVIAGGYAIFNAVGNLCTTISAGNLPAVVQYPIITGGCIFISAIEGLIFGERITKKTILGIVLVFTGTILMMF